MFSWAERRRIIYLLVIFGVLALVIGLGLWFRYPVPTCNDGKQNQDETGIDCGGVCPLACLDEALPIRVLWTRVLPSTGGKAVAGVLIENPNYDYGTEGLEYRLRIDDQENLFVTAIDDEVDISPREKFLLIHGGVPVGERLISSAFFDVIKSGIWQKSEMTSSQIVIAEKEWLNKDIPTLRLRVQNVTDFQLAEVPIGIAVLDGQKNVVGLNSTLVSAIGPRASVETIVSWPNGLLGIPVGSLFQVVVETYPRIGKIVR